MQTIHAGKVEGNPWYIVTRNVVRSLLAIAVFAATLLSRVGIVDAADGQWTLLDKMPKPEAPAHKFQWIRTSQNCLMWAPSDFNEQNIKIHSCDKNRVSGDVAINIFVNGPRRYIHHRYFYKGFFLSSDKECFTKTTAYNIRLHEGAGSPRPLIYVGTISELSDDKSTSIFGAGTTIWVDVAYSGYRIAIGPTTVFDDFDLCREGSDHNVGVSPLFEDVQTIYVLSKKVHLSAFGDVLPDTLRKLALAIAQFVKSKTDYFKLSSEREVDVKILDDTFSRIYADATIQADEKIVRGINYVRKAQEAVRAQQQEAEREAETQARIATFLQKAGSPQPVRPDDIQANPFRYDGRNIFTLTIYKEMVGKTTGAFEVTNNVEIESSGLDPNHSMKPGTPTVLAGKVIGTKRIPVFGGNKTVLVLSLGGLHACESDLLFCKDVVEKYSFMPQELLRGR